MPYPGLLHPECMPLQQATLDPYHLRRHSNSPDLVSVGFLGLVLMGRAILSKSLIQFSVDGWGCVPSLLFNLRPNYGVLAVLGCNLKSDRMISVHFQGKPFNITIIQLYAPASNAEEAEVEWFYEDLQGLLKLTPKKDAFSL